MLVVVGVLAGCPAESESVGVESGSESDTGTSGHSPSGDTEPGTTASTAGSSSASEATTGVSTDSSSSSGSESGSPTGGEQLDCAAQTTLEGCAAVYDTPPGQSDFGCAWVNVINIEGAGASCEFGMSEGRCIPTEYQGDGCLTSPRCSTDEAISVYHRELPDGTYDIFEAPVSGGIEALCEYNTTEWELCIWDKKGGISSRSPDECECICR